MTSAGDFDMPLMFATRELFRALPDGLGDLTQAAADAEAHLTVRFRERGLQLVQTANGDGHGLRGRGAPGEPCARSRLEGRRHLRPADNAPARPL